MDAGGRSLRGRGTASRGRVKASRGRGTASRCQARAIRPGDLAARAAHGCHTIGEPASHTSTFPVQITPTPPVQTTPTPTPTPASHTPSPSSHGSAPSSQSTLTPSQLADIVALAVQPTTTPTPSESHSVFIPTARLPSTPEHIEEDQDALGNEKPPLEVSDEETEDEPPPRPVRRHVPKDYEYDAKGKVIMKVVSIGWIPAEVAAAAMSHAIKSEFRGPHHCYDVVPQDVKDKWWKEFKTKVSWAPADTAEIEKVYNKKIRKCLSNLLTKQRQSGKRPIWIAEDAWTKLLAYWDTDDFKKISTQNKANRASTRGGAVHTTGRISHLEIARQLTLEHGRPVHPDELFMATHTHRTGGWVDTRSRDTYREFNKTLHERESHVSMSGKLVDGSTRIEMWMEKAGGRKRGRCYGTADLAGNARLGKTSLIGEEFLTPSPSPPSTSNGESQAISDNETLRLEVVEARQVAAQAIEENRKTQSELENVKKLVQQLMAERSTGTWNNVRQAHLDYDPRLHGEPLGDAAASLLHLASIPIASQRSRTQIIKDLKNKNKKLRK